MCLIPIGLLRVPHSLAARSAAKLGGIRGQLLYSWKMLMLSVELSVAPLPIRYPCMASVCHSLYKVASKVSSQAGSLSLGLESGKAGCM